MASWLPRIRILIQFKPNRRARPSTTSPEKYFVFISFQQRSENEAVEVLFWQKNGFTICTTLWQNWIWNPTRISVCRTSEQPTNSQILRRPWNPERTSVAICCANPSIACEIGFDLTPFLRYSITFHAYLKANLGPIRYNTPSPRQTDASAQWIWPLPPPNTTLGRSFRGIHINNDAFSCERRSFLLERKVDFW